MPGLRETFDCSFSMCRTGIRRCWQFVLCHKPLMLAVKDQYNILCLGLTGSGKSTILAQLVGENTDNIQPTNGFNIKTLPIKGIVVSIKELGGSGRVQNFWNYYFADKNAIMFVIDSAGSDEELQLAKETLKSVLSNARLRGRPCLVLGTHSDISGSKSQQELESLLQNVMQGFKWQVMICSSFDRQLIRKAFETLIDMIAVSGQ
ncbi:ADP-ribosylation factor-like protein 15 [Oppia nitens]|uniref:ADP-ribosylation factor-like protein 15 n=1 Tax=Oppia nitens TaxID=1686743 RepID=UPI0023D9AB7E|nr:ADP-ribosylation factor-like protein 15 [Oppia nitens]